jgi:hypothetical protein
VLPAWSCDRPGYHAVLAMHGFSLQESGEYALAEKAARAALDLNPLDARAHHVMAHVFEMTERPAEGLRWMLAHAAQWDGDTLVATHCWWHVELFHLSVGDAPGALAGYERHIRPRIGRRASIGALIDGAALLWRLRLRGRSVPSLWAELAEGWSAHIDDGFCSFNDIHAMLAFVGAADAGRVARLEAVLLRNEPLATRYGETTRQLGLPACRALMACGRADFIDAIRLLSALPAFVHRIGGSHAQRDVLHLTLLSAVEHIRRPPPSADERKARTAWCEGTAAAPARRTARQTPPETSMMAPVE